MTGGFPPQRDCNAKSVSMSWGLHVYNILRPRQDGRHCPDDIFICIFLNETEYHSMKIPLKYVPKVPINNIPALVQIMAWRRLGAEPLSELMIVVLPTHIYVTRSQWVKHRSIRTLCNPDLNKWIKSNQNKVFVTSDILCFNYSNPKA